MIIDANAHVVDIEQTWSYMEGSDKKFRPQLFSSAENSATQYWFCEGKAVGFRPLSCPKCNGCVDIIS